VRLRALVLAAGLGMRLRPLTDGTPKPLLPVLGEPILAHTLRQLAAVGCEAAAINLHHGGDQVRRVLGDELAGLPLTYSFEPRLLGTLGALRPLDDFLAAADLVLIVNGDSLCRWPFAELLRRHRERGAPATLLLAASADVAQFGGGVEIGRGGEVLALRPAASGGGTRRRVFAGAHVLSPRLVRRIAAMSMAVPADIVRDLYEPLLAEEPGCLATLSTRRRWHDLGTPRRYLAAALDWAGAGGGGRWISPSAVVSPAASVRRVMIEADARVAAGAVVEGSVLLPGARVGADCEVRDSILGPGVELATGSRLAGRVVVAGGAPTEIR
jgi:mannose-1-phosphate guanylyltransferase